MSGRVLGLILLGLSAAPLAAAELGRLFLTPAERAAIDRIRYAAPVPAAEVEAPTPDAAGRHSDDAPATPVGPAVTLDGYVQRSAGPPTVWVNGTDSYHGNFAEQGVDARGLEVDEARVRLPRRGVDAPLRLKPGQTFDPETARISEAYERRERPEPTH